MKNANETRPVPRLSDAAVEAKTAKTWQEWFAMFDAAGVPGWWAQIVTVG